jgi:hypothetical protein
MKRVLAVLLTFCSAYSVAQTVTHDTSVQKMFASASFGAPTAPLEMVSPRSEFVTTPTPVARNTHSYRGFAILATISVAATIADVELTSNCLKTSANCREANPILGSNPSRARLYGFNVPITAGEILLSGVLRRRSPERKFWRVPLISVTGTHAAGIASNMWAR